MKNILIIGCGYIGSLVASLLVENHHVIVTTTSEEKKTDLEKKFYDCELLDTKDEKTLQRLIDIADVAIITLAPKTKDIYQATYLDTANKIKKCVVARKKPLHIIYTSATSVYGECKGALVTEKTPPLPNSEQGRILLETENTYLGIHNPFINVCVFRLSEIYGPTREIKKKILHFRDKKAPGDGSQYSNMIHAVDVARAISFAIEHNLTSIYNLSDDTCLTRKELYDKASAIYRLNEVEFDPSLKSIHLGNKRVSNEKIKKTGFCFQYAARSI